MMLTIVSAEKVLYEGEAQSVTVPGGKGPFEVLEGHAPIISTLRGGKLSFVTKDGEQEMTISGGFIDVHDGRAEVCVEL